MCEITARVILNGHELTDIPVINPGDWSADDNGERAATTILCPNEY